MQTNVNRIRCQHNVYFTKKKHDGSTNADKLCLTVPPCHQYGQKTGTALKAKNNLKAWACLSFF